MQVSVLQLGVRPCALVAVLEADGPLPASGLKHSRWLLLLSFNAGG